MRVWIILLGCSLCVAQSARPDMNGLWDGERPTGDLVRAIAPAQVPFTPFGAERYKNIDMAKNPNAQCLPPGPSRAITGPSPFQIVQSAGSVAILFENHFIYRLIYTDGTQHPSDIADYPAFMGHSVGKWDGDKLTVDTVGINDRTWLDSAGMEHSPKLHLTETFRKTAPDRIEYVVTYDDPAFFTKPWSMTLGLKRMKKDDRLMEYVCEENEKDQKFLQATPRQSR